MTEHWIDDKNLRARFWATANERGLTKEQVYAALEVESVHDYEGDSQEAIAALHAYAMFHDRVEPPPPAQDESQPESDEVQARIAALVSTQPEAPIVVWTRFFDHKGYEWSFTVRPGLPDDVLTALNRSAMVQLGNFHKAAERFGWRPTGYIIPPASTPTERDVNEPPRGKPVGPAQPAAPPSGSSVLKSGTSPLKTIIVADGVVEYEVDGFRWPMKDHRGVETADQVFDDSAANWKPSNLDPGVRSWAGGAMVDWEQVERNGKKYYNVVRVWTA